MSEFTSRNRGRVPSGHVAVVDPPAVPLHEPRTCTDHGPTIRVEWTSGDKCPLCEACAIALEAMGRRDDALMDYATADKERQRLRKAIETAIACVDGTEDAAPGSNGHAALLNLREALEDP